MTTQERAADLHERLLYAAPELWRMHIHNCLEDAMADAAEDMRERCARSIDVPPGVDLPEFPSALRLHRDLAALVRAQPLAEKK